MPSRTAVARVRAGWRAFFSAYDPADPDAHVFRAAQLQSVLHLTPLSMLINVGNALLLCTVLWSQVAHGPLVAWVLMIVALAAAGLRGWQRARRRGPRRDARRSAIRHATRQAILLGLAWALLPAWAFPVVDGDGRFLLGMVATGMICAGGFALSSLPTAATGYVIALGSGMTVALLRWDGALAAGALMLLLTYSAIVIVCVWIHSKTFGGRLVAEAHAERQSQVIGLLLRDFEDSASDLLWEIDARGRLTHVAPRLAALLGLAPDALRRVRATLLLRGRARDTDDARHHWADFAAALARGTPFREQAICITGADGPRWWSLGARPLVDETGRLSGWRGVAADVTDRQLAHRRLTWLAHNDALTGLVNRVQFRDLLRSWLSAPAPIAPFAVLTFDLDGFKQVNDTQGHAAGDLLLRTLGERLLSVARRNDPVARLGGDEFAMLLHGVGDERSLQPLLARLTEALAQPARANDRTLALRASIGVAFAPVHGTDVDTLISHADIAMYAVKHRGGQGCRVFDPTLAEIGRRRAMLAQDLRGAAARGEFRLVFQPQVRASDDEVCGLEALLRWRHPRHGDVEPSEFIGIAETAGLMPEIGDWVIAQACRHARGWPASLRVSINVSPTQLGAPGFVEAVLAAADGLRTDRIELEITESALAEDADRAVATLRALKSHGLRIALDDFGTGYSALGYLRRFPFDSLKIDRSFVTDLAHDDEAKAIVDTILAMARALRMTTIAEGVETEAEAALLRDRGCTLLQGWWVSRPMDSGDVAAFLVRWRADRETLDLATMV